MSGRTQHDRLTQQVQRLAARERQVLTDVVEHGFLTAGQVARLHFSEVGHPGTRMRITQRSLLRLVDEELLTRSSRRVGGVRAGSASYTYRATAEGQRTVAFLQGQGIPPLRTSREPGLNFVAHSVAVAEIWVTLQEATRDGRCELLAYQAEPACWRTSLGGLGEARRLRPDGHAHLAVGDYELAWFLEVDRGTEGSSALRRKLIAYLDYYRSGREQQQHGFFPRVLWQVETPARQRLLDRLIGELPGGAHRLFVTTRPDTTLAVLTQPPEEGASS